MNNQNFNNQTKESEVKGQNAYRPSAELNESKNGRSPLFLNSNFKETAGGGSGRERPSPQSSKSKGKLSPACISDIFSNGSNENERMEYLVVNEGVCRVKRDFKVSEDELLLCGGGGGRKGPVLTFSRKSRRNLMIKLAEMKRLFEFWQDFTFADDIMENLSIKERAKLSSKILKAFKLWLERQGYKIQGVWKREWRPRLSGALTGQYVPHYHFLFLIEGISEKEYFDIAKLFAHKWVEFTGTGEYTKALRVALHHKSYRLIKSRKQANQYISDRKYISKNGKFVSNESIGRNWGYLGEPEFSESEKFYLYMPEMVLLRRILRRFVRKNKSGFRKLISKKYKRFFVFIERPTIHKVLEWIAQSQMNRAVEGVPF